MARVIVLDASVLIGYLDSEDEHHTAAEALLAHAVDDDLAANSLTLAEVLVAPTQNGRLDSTFAAFHDLEIKELPFPADTAARLARLRATTGLKMRDCCVLLAAEDASADVASLDKRLIQAAEKQGLSVLRP